MAMMKGGRGARGARGVRGPAGPPGRTGATGARGATGAKGEASSAPVFSQLNEIEHSIEDIYKELDVQLTRMGQIQRQVDELRGKVRDLLMSHKIS